MSVTKLFVAAQVALSSKKGAAMVEYALLAALVAVVAASVLGTVGTNVSAKFQAIVTAI